MIGDRAISVTLSIVEAETGVPKAEILSAIRIPRVSAPRHLVMWLAHRHLNVSLKQLGRHMGRDHSLVLWACRQVDAKAANDPAFAERSRGLVLQAKDALILEADAAHRTLASDERSQLRAALRLAEAREQALRERLAAAVQLRVPHNKTSTSLVSAVERFLQAKGRLERETYTRSEATARREAQEAFEDLATAYTNFADATRTRANTSTATIHSREAAHVQ